MTKTEIVKQHLAANEYRAALRIAKTFKIGLTREEQRILQYAYECMVYPSSYRQLGRDVECTIKQGIQLLLKIYASK